MNTPEPRRRFVYSLIFDDIHASIMVLLTLVFMALFVYGLVKAGSDEIAKALGPIITVIVGYFFGRQPGQANEKALKQEIERQVELAQAAYVEANKAKQAQVEVRVDAERAQQQLKQVKKTLTGAAASKPASGAVPPPPSGAKAAGRAEEDEYASAPYSAPGGRTAPGLSSDQAIQAALLLMDDDG